MRTPTTWHPSQDQDIEELMKILEIDEGFPKPEIDAHRFRKVYLTENQHIMLDAMVRLVAILGPGEGDADPAHEAKERLRRLVYGNLKTHEPELEPYEE